MSAGQIFRSWALLDVRECGEGARKTCSQDSPCPTGSGDLLPVKDLILLGIGLAVQLATLDLIEAPKKSAGQSACV